MRLGLRTVKTVLSATLAIFLAQATNLLYPPSAGIIALLSVTNTKRSTLKTGFSRLLSLTLATVIAFLSFTLLGFTPFAFGIYLLFFLPISSYFKLEEGISVSSVLVTHYLVEKSLSLQMIKNEFFLMIIGVGLALLMNLYMPDKEKKIKENQLIIETLFKDILQEMADFLTNEKSTQLFAKCQEISTFIIKSQKEAKIQMENQLFNQDNYYLDYFHMRRLQANFLKDMITSLEKITIDKNHSQKIRQLLFYTAENLSTENDGKEILKSIQKVYISYEQMPLPQSREEFENRARLFHFLQLFESFIKIKADYYEEKQP